jgi:hypothetical protein
MALFVFPGLSKPSGKLYTHWKQESSGHGHRLLTAWVNALNITKYIPPPTLEPNHPKYTTQSTYCSENIEHISSDGWSQLANNLKDKR